MSPKSEVVAKSEQKDRHEEVDGKGEKKDSLGKRASDRMISKN
jgi:hypothetical protein